MIQQAIGSTDRDQQEIYRKQFTQEVTLHDFAEESLVRRAFQRHLGTKGDDITESERRDYEKVRNTAEPATLTNSHPDKGGPGGV